PGATPTSGPLSNTVGGIDNTAEGTTGLDLPLDETTGPLTDQLDQTLDQTLDGLGPNGNR
ncbi:MAG: hypothetical protein ACRDL3_03340, partial [Solirubrobacterales bacterium]